MEKENNVFSGTCVPVFMSLCVQQFLGVSLINPLLLHGGFNARSLIWVGLKERQHKCCCT